MRRDKYTVVAPNDDDYSVDYTDEEITESPYHGKVIWDERTKMELSATYYECYSVNNANNFYAVGYAEEPVVRLKQR